MKKKLLALLSALALCVGLMVPASAAGQTFTDVPSTYWAHDAIQYVTDEGLFQGTSATTFEPGTTMTRAMLIQVLFRYAGSPQLPDTWVFPYRDVPDDAYYWDAAFWGRHRNIFADEFVENCDALRPNEAVTRGEFATMLWKFAREVLGSESVAVGTVESGPFTDMDDGDPGVTMDVQRSMLGWAYPNGILSGTSATTMSPNAPVTRAQVATMLMRYDQTFNDDSQSGNPGGGTSQPDKPEAEYTLSLGIMKSSLEVGASTIVEISTIPFSAKDNLTFTFMSSDTSVATIKTTASNKVGCTVKAVGPGNATITVTDSNGITAEAKVTVTGSSTVDPTPSGNEYADVKDEIIKLTNNVRAENGIAALTKSDLLMKIAQQRAEESAQMQKIDHGRPDGSSMYTIFAEYGLDFTAMQFGENLATSTDLDASLVVDALEASEGHFKTMIASNKTLIGVGVALGEDGRFYFSQIFTNKD